MRKICRTRSLCQDGIKIGIIYQWKIITVAKKIKKVALAKIKTTQLPDFDFDFDSK